MNDSTTTLNRSRSSLALCSKPIYEPQLTSLALTRANGPVLPVLGPAAIDSGESWILNGSLYEGMDTDSGSRNLVRAFSCSWSTDDDGGCKFALVFMGSKTASLCWCLQAARPTLLSARNGAVPVHRCVQKVMKQKAKAEKNGYVGNSKQDLLPQLVTSNVNNRSPVGCLGCCALCRCIWSFPTPRTFCWPHQTCSAASRYQYWTIIIRHQC